MRERNILMFDWVEIASILTATLTAGGWLRSRRLRKKDDERHAVELERAHAEADAIRQRSELDYTKEILEIYSAHIVQPLQTQIDEVRTRLDRNEKAISMAFGCALYPDCPVLLHLQSQGENPTTPNL